MTEHAGLLQAIRDSPDDDTPRLVYADWLDEQGEAVRAEWIRLHCRLAHFCVLSRPNGSQFFTSDDLLPECRADLLAPLLSLGLTALERPMSPAGCRFTLNRGFVEHIEVHGPDEADHFVTCLGELCRRTPLRSVGFLPGPDYDHYYGRRDPRALYLVRALMQNPAIALLDTINFGWYLLTDAAGRAILDSPYLRTGQSLVLAAQRFNPPVRGAIVERFGEKAILDEEIPF
jgi:uncharacterized protein (TIGR02996 family)